MHDSVLPLAGKVTVEVESELEFQASDEQLAAYCGSTGWESVALGSRKNRSTSVLEFSMWTARGFTHTGKFSLEAECAEARSVMSGHKSILDRGKLTEALLPDLAKGAAVVERVRIGTAFDQSSQRQR